MTTGSAWDVSSRNAIGAAIDVWIVSLDLPATVSHVLEDVLSDDELTRANRFVFERDRRRFVAGRSALRQILSGYTGVSPETLAFAYGAKGKPSLDAPVSRLEFNVSHSEACAAIAVSEAGDVGIDLECTTRRVEFEALASRFFSSGEAAELRALPESIRRQAFFNCWTRKEAYIKAIGEGLACPLDSFAVTLRPGAPAAIQWIDGEPADDWRLWAFWPSDHYVGAVATRAPVDGIRVRQFDRPAAAPTRLSALAGSEALR
jgi:4'-phosphopantetheinyl transferase